MIAVQGKIIKELFAGLTYVAITFTDDTGIQIEIEHDWNGDTSIEVYGYEA